METTRGTITVELLFFARTREIAGCNTATLSIPEGSDVSSLRAAVADRFPALAGPLASCRIAVDEVFANDTDGVRDGATVAIIPPVSGG